MTKIVITHSDDTVTITGLVSDDNKGGQWDLTKEHIDAVVKKIETAYADNKELKDKVPFKSWRFMSDEEIITHATTGVDRTFRDAWKHNTEGKLHTCIDTAKTIHRDRLRRKRIPLLDQLDVESQRALEDGDTSKLDTIKQKKQKLRDVVAHPDIDAAQTVEDLKAITIETHGV